jgi:hypothetical protein
MTAPLAQQAAMYPAFVEVRLVRPLERVSLRVRRSACSADVLRSVAGINARNDFGPLERAVDSFQGGEAGVVAFSMVRSTRLRDRRRNTIAIAQRFITYLEVWRCRAFGATTPSRHREAQYLSFVLLRQLEDKKPMAKFSDVLLRKQDLAVCCVVR